METNVLIIKNESLERFLIENFNWMLEKSEVVLPIII